MSVSLRDQVSYEHIFPSLYVVRQRTAPFRCDSRCGELVRVVETYTGWPKNIRNDQIIKKLC